eukprot:691360-Pelagomonas_calceolata.AAC.2
MQPQLKSCSLHRWSSSFPSKPQIGTAPAAAVPCAGCCASAPSLRRLHYSCAGHSDRIRPEQALPLESPKHRGWQGSILWHVCRCCQLCASHWAGPADGALWLRIGSAAEGSHVPLVAARSPVSVLGKLPFSFMGELDPTCLDGCNGDLHQTQFYVVCRAI